MFCLRHSSSLTPPPSPEAVLPTPAVGTSPAVGAAALLPCPLLQPGLPPRVYCCKKLVQKIVSFVSNSSAILPRYISVNKKGNVFFFFFMTVRKLYIYFSSSRDVQSCNGIRWKIICKFLGFFLCTALTEVEGARVEGI